MIRSTSASPFRSSSTLGRPPRTKLTAALLAVGAFLVVFVAAGPARAGSIDCSPSIVWFDGYTGGRLAILCNGDYNFNDAIFANLNETACPGKNVSIDVLKIWTSMATAYQMSARKIYMDYNDPAGSCTIKTIVNIRNDP